MSAMKDSRPLRTLHIDTERGWRGGEQQALYLMKGLRARGHDVQLVCRPGEPFAERAAEAGIPVRPMRPKGELDPVAVFRVAAWLRKERFDVVHAHTSHAHALAVSAAALCSKNARPACIVSRRVAFSIRRGVLSRIKYRHVVDRYIAISDCIRRVLIEDGIAQDKIRLVYSSVDPSRYEGVFAAGLRRELGLPAEAPLLVNVAALTANKGQSVLLKAFSRAVQESPNLRCVIVGDGPLRQALEAEARVLKIADLVLFAGFRNDPLRCIAMGDVFVMTSHMEGLCTSILDALGLGRPVVVTRAGGMPEIVEHGHNGLLAENRDPASIAEQITRMLGDKDLRRRCVANGLRTVRERFSVDTLVEGTLAVYRECLDPRSEA